MAQAGAASSALLDGCGRVWAGGVAARLYTSSFFCLSEPLHISGQLPPCLSFVPMLAWGKCMSAPPPLRASSAHVFSPRAFCHVRVTLCLPAEALALSTLAGETGISTATDGREKPAILRSGD